MAHAAVFMVGDDHVPGKDNTANFWRERYANMVDDPNWPRNLARSVAFAIRVDPYLIRKTWLLVSSSRGDR